LGTSGQTNKRSKGTGLGSRRRENEGGDKGKKGVLRKPIGKGQKEKPLLTGPENLDPCPYGGRGEEN